MPPEDDLSLKVCATALGQLVVPLASDPPEYWVGEPEPPATERRSLARRRLAGPRLGRPFARLLGRVTPADATREQLAAAMQAEVARLDEDLTAWISAFHTRHAPVTTDDAVAIDLDPGADRDAGRIATKEEGDPDDGPDA
jgi:hypothetical protein